MGTFNLNHTNVWIIFIIFLPITKNITIGLNHNPLFRFGKTLFYTSINTKK